MSVNRTRLPCCQPYPEALRTPTAPPAPPPPDLLGAAAADEAVQGALDGGQLERHEALGQCDGGADNLGLRGRGGREREGEGAERDGGGVDRVLGTRVWPAKDVGLERTRVAAVGDVRGRGDCRWWPGLNACMLAVRVPRVPGREKPTTLEKSTP